MAHNGGGGSSSSSSRPKYTLAQFKATGELGAGSFGRVERVVNVDSDEVFAMKILEKARVRQKNLEEQLRREVLTQIRVKHANVVHLHYYFEDAAKIYCLLEFADGGTLFSKLKALGNVGLADEPAARLFRDTASGLAYLHSLRVVHRDMKPENILLFGPGERAKIGDFGWCVELTDKEPLRNTFCGTLDYLSPEMLTNEPHGAAVDLWALGVLLFEMLLAHSPFAASSQKESMDRIMAVRFDIPAGSISKAPEALIRGLLVRRAASRTLLDALLRSDWLRPGSAGAVAPADASAAAAVPGLLDETVAAPRKKAPPAEVALPADLDDQTVVVLRNQAAKVPPSAASAAAKAAASPSPQLPPTVDSVTSALDDRTRIVPRSGGAGAAAGSGASAGTSGGRAEASSSTAAPGGLDARRHSMLPRSSTAASPSAGYPRAPSASSSSGAAAASSAPAAAASRPSPAEDKSRSPSPLPDLLSTVRDAGVAQDLDGRLLAAPPALPPPASSSYAGTSRTCGGDDQHFVKDLVVSSVPRPKAKSSRVR